MGTYLRSLRPAWAAMGACLLLASCAAPPDTPPALFAAPLAGPNAAAGGRAEASYDHRTGLLRWRVVHEGLSGPVTAAHIHGPAGPDQHADAVLPLEPRSVQPIAGQARITPEQWNQLDSGQWYVDLHTARFPGGELRGQLRPR